MRTTLSCILLLLFTNLHSRAQHVDIQPFIDSWEIADTSQSHQAQVFYDTLTRNKDTLQYQQVVQQLYAYLKKHPDSRLEVRTIMYQALGALEFGYPWDEYIELMQKAIKMAHRLQDNQLIAELYGLYAEFYSYKNYNYVLYNYKAIELQRRIGFSHFPYVHHRFFAVSSALYRSADYRQSIAFGLEGLTFKKTDLQHWNSRVYIDQLDILGAAYKKLGLYDSSRYYYQQLLDVLQTKFLPPSLQKLWTGIAKGNIGHVLILQKKYAEALPLIEEHLQNSIEVGDTLNMALARNALAQFYFLQQQYTMALPAWQQSYKQSLEVKAPDIAMEAAQGIANIYRATGKIDSAFHYYNLYHRYKEELAANAGSSRLSAINARVAFDDLQHSLTQAQYVITRERNARNALLVGIALVLIIVLLLYNRHRLKKKYQWQLFQRRQEAAELEVRTAKGQIAAFASHIVEKNNLIELMQRQLALHEQNQNQQVIAESLTRYTLVTNAEWEKFRAEFAKAYPDFLTTLRRQLTQITPAEERLATLIYLQLNNAQIANTLGIGKDSVARSKRRLKQRLDLPDTVSLEDFLLRLLSTSL